ncbi:MAG: DUF177 domain-containing protein [Sporomusaceae bacterium]|nr:DUF177 domain-containing protein [Sporomusaceae bacterium]
MKSLIIDVSRVKKDVGAVAEYRFSDVSLSTGTVTYTDLDVSGKVLNNGAVLEVAGRIMGQARFVCGRCLESYLAKVEIPFLADFREGSPERDPEADVSWYQGDCINITEPVREALILAEPFKPICRQTCRGLCPVCGKNLNIESCACTTETINPKFAVLQKLLDANQEP